MNLRYWFPLLLTALGGSLAFIAFIALDFRSITEVTRSNNAPNYTMNEVETIRFTQTGFLSLSSLQ